MKFSFGSAEGLLHLYMMKIVTGTAMAARKVTARFFQKLAIATVLNLCKILFPE